MFVSIAYRENAAPAEAYERVNVVDLDGVEVASFATGDPVADWASCLAYLKGQGRSAYLTSSVTHFVFDVSGYRLIEDKEGVARIVVDEHDTPKSSAAVGHLPSAADAPSSSA